MSVVDDALAQLSSTREVAASVPHFMSIPGVLAGTDLLVTVPARVASLLTSNIALCSYAHPLRLAPFVVSQIWHSRTENSPAHTWLRATVARICADI